MKHPQQPLHIDGRGTIRFVANELLRDLVDRHVISLNELALKEYRQKDRVQFAQLIGYSLSGYESLSYVSEEAYAEAELAADLLGPAAEVKTDCIPKGVITHHKSVLTEAESLVHGDRNADYGHPLDDFKRTAKIWGAILGIEIKPEQVGLCMCGVKISRECNKSKRDNMVDLAGYAETVAWCKDEAADREFRETTFAPVGDVLDTEEDVHP